jgi:hypothetical protein
MAHETVNTILKKEQEYRDLKKTHDARCKDVLIKEIGILVITMLDKYENYKEL